VVKCFDMASKSQPKQNNNLRIPPQNIDAEKALLGSIMLKPEVLYEIIDYVAPESFYIEKHRLIFKTML